MKKRRLWIPLVLLCVIVSLCAGAQGEENGATAEWTVMFYMCGSDLESQYGFATDNLLEIAKCHPYYSFFPHTVMPGDEELVDAADKCGLDGVNVVIETGGCKKWHTEDKMMHIDTSALQRWHYAYDGAVYDSLKTIRLDETLPLQSMADPETLGDFIRWSAEKYPAKKYALVLWDHGGGSKTGLFVDELFNNDIMPLDELGAALRAGGVYLECVVLDACMMANVETVCAIGDSAHWMVASEEVVGGKGTAVGEWLKQLCFIPEMDGEGLGRMICDTTQMKYSREESVTEQEILTWSVIDLTRKEQLAAVLDHVFMELCRMYAENPLQVINLSKNMLNGESYGAGNDSQWDMGETFFVQSESLWDPALRREVLQVLKEAVVFCVRGPARSASRGLSFCYAAGFNRREMDAYARNCPSAYCLALLDAISPWTAPDWVYERVERLPDIETIPAFRDRVVKYCFPDGTPVFDFISDESKDWLEPYVMQYNLHRINGNGETVCLGSMPVSMIFREIAEEEYLIGFGTDSPAQWPAIEGETCAFEVRSINRAGWTRMWGNVPVKLDGKYATLRCSYDADEDYYTVHGLWDGYDLNTGMFNRNVRSLSQVAGQEFSLVYPIHHDKDGVSDDYYRGKNLKMFRSLDMKNAPLEDGLYYIEFVIYDCFMRPRYLEPLEMRIENGKASYPGLEEWQGETELTVPEEYW